MADHRMTPLRPGRGLKVPSVTPWFWLAKGLSTAMGEATSDYLVHRLDPVPAVLLGFVAFVVALAVQLRTRRYSAVPYWVAVAMVGVFGTMAADVLHVGFGVPYAVSTPLFAVVLACVFLVWWGTERTLSVHTIDTTRRELFYWAAVCATFALGTAAGDFTATTLHIGYLPSVAVFAALICIPAAAYAAGRWSPVLCFWFAYVLTRPLGASVADGFGKPSSVGGLGFGDGPVAAVLVVLLACVVAYLAVTRIDVHPRARHAQSEARRRGSTA